MSLVSVKYVSEASIAAADRMEEKFLTLPPEAGIIFVSVHPEPIEGGKCHIFDVRLGVPKSFDPGTGVALVQKVLELEVNFFEIRASVYLGTSGAARDKNSQRTH